MLCGKIIWRLLSVDWVDFDVQCWSFSRGECRVVAADKRFLKIFYHECSEQIKYWDILEKCSFLSEIILSKLLPAKTIINDRNRFLCWKQKTSIKLWWARITSDWEDYINTSTEDCRKEFNHLVFLV